MKRGLLILAVVVALGVVITWASIGSHRVWTQTEKPRGTVDEITGIVDQTPVKTFIPGIDFLGAGLIGAGVLAGVSFLFRSKSISQQQQTNKQ